MLFQAPVFLTPTSGGPLLLHSNRDFGVDPHLGRVLLQTLLIPGVYWIPCESIISVQEI